MRQYSGMTVGPRTSTSPTSPSSTGEPSAAAIRTLQCGTGRPAVARSRWASCSGVIVTTGIASVSP